jgi:hypothetical protein
MRMRSANGEDVRLGHDHLLEPQPAEDGDQHAAPADDHVGPGLLEPGVVDAVGAGLGGQRAEHVLGGVTGEREVVDAVAVVGGEPDLDRGHGADRAGQADEGAGLGCRRELAEDVLEVGVGEADAGGQLLGLGRVVLEVALAEADAAHVDRHDPLHLGRADDELGRAAADVDDEEGTPCGVELGSRALERQPALLVAAQQLGPGADEVLDGVEQLVAVGGVAGG